MSGLWIRNLWARKKLHWQILGMLLLPASWAYLAAVQSRNYLYSRGWLKARKLDKAVISIGNLTVGGSGKTPTCVWLSDELCRRGYRVGILTRGYKRKDARITVLSGGPSAPAGGEEVESAGDEPTMMARIYGRTVAVGKDRYAAALELLRGHDIDVLILDDGFQHRRLKRDVDLLLLGSGAEGRLLPAGPLREPPQALDRADFYLLTGQRESWHRWLPSNGDPRCFCGSLHAQALIGLDSVQWKQFPLNLLYRSKVLAVAGIANPEGFYKTIREWEAEIVDAVEFGDHHAYSAEDWQRITRLARRADFIVTTEKDILKLLRFPFAKDKLLALRVAMVIDQGDSLVNAIIHKIKIDRPSAIHKAV